MHYTTSEINFDSYSQTLINIIITSSVPNQTVYSMLIIRDCFREVVVLMVFRKYPTLTPSECLLSNLEGSRFFKRFNLKGNNSQNCSPYSCQAIMTGLDNQNSWFSVCSQKILILCITTLTVGHFFIIRLGYQFHSAPYIVERDLYRTSIKEIMINIDTVYLLLTLWPCLSLL